MECRRRGPYCGRHARNHPQSPRVPWQPLPGSGQANCESEGPWGGGSPFAGPSGPGSRDGPGPRVGRGGHGPLEARRTAGSEKAHVALVVECDTQCVALVVECVALGGRVCGVRSSSVWRRVA